MASADDGALGPSPDALLAILGCIYRDDIDDDTWLASIVEAMAPYLEAGKGVAGCLFDATDVEHLNVHALVVRDVDPSLVDALSTFHLNASADFVRVACHGPSVCSTVSSRPELDAALRSLPGYELLAAAGIEDFLGIRAASSNGRGAYMFVPLPERGPSPHPKSFVFGRVALHMAEALRLREAAVARAAEAAETSYAGDASEPSDAADADLLARAREIAALSDDPQEADGDRFRAAGGRAGTTSDVAPKITSDLLPPPASAVHYVARADDAAVAGHERGAQPESSRTAEDVWDQLSKGQFALVDHFDYDGRRFIVARRPRAAANASPGQPATLTPREAQVTALAAEGYSNKLIAYEIGLSISTVALHLSRASKKLGVTSRVGLIRAFKQATPSTPDLEAVLAAAAAAAGGAGGHGPGEASRPDLASALTPAPPSSRAVTPPPPASRPAKLAVRGRRV